MNNFTPRAQQVLALARKEADRFNHNYVGTEHLLLGLIKLGQGVAVNVLQKMGLDLETVRMEVEKQVGSGPETKMVGNIPYTPRVKKVLALAGKEAQGPQPFLRRHRAHPAWPAPRRRRRRGSRSEEPRGRYRADPQRNPERTRSEFYAAGKRSGTGRDGRAVEERRQDAGAARLWPRSDGSREKERARSGHRPAERNRARHPGALPPDEKQSGIARRSRRWQDRDRRRAGPGNREWQCAGAFARQKGHHPRPRADGRRHQISRTIRRANQSGHGRNSPLEERHPVHRRAAHDRRRGFGRRRDGRLEHHQAGA